MTFQWISSPRPSITGTEQRLQKAIRHIDRTDDSGRKPCTAVAISDLIAAGLHAGYRLSEVGLVRVVALSGCIP